MTAPNNTSLAKLLATENITVEQSNVSTASFDVKNRVLTLPIWATEDKFVEDHMTGHEVGHALYTPLDGWHDAVCSKGGAFKSYLNVIEDARIEKLIQRKYPGLRSSFVKSYRKLLADGFFGADLETINSMGLIDRINTYFKCGVSSGVEFAKEERVWLKRIDDAETWEQVVQIAEELFASEKEKAEQEQQEQQEAESEEAEDQEDDEEDFGDDISNGSSTDEEDEEEGDDEESETDSSGEDSDDFDDLFNDDDQPEQENAGQEGGHSDDIEDLIASQTDENLRNSIDQNLTEVQDENVKFITLRLRQQNTDAYVITSKDLAEQLDDPSYRPHMRYRNEESATPDEIRRRAKGQRLAARMMINWTRENKKSVQTMVKEFEMRKSASEFKRAGLSRTGTLDTVKMNNYKITEDIFRKVTVIPEGKNHGFIMMLDMSGSMHHQFYHVVQHTILMASFCRQIGVPFRVYGFIDYDRAPVESPITHNNNDLVITQDAKLLELFNENMSKSQFSKVAGELLFFGWSLDGGAGGNLLKDEDLGLSGKYDGHDQWHARKDARWCTSAAFHLSGTPLDSGIALLIPQAIKFREQNRLDKLHTIFLTDGCSHPISYRDSGNGEPRVDYLTNGYRNRISVVNEYTNQTVRLVKDSQGRLVRDMTQTLLDMYKDATGSVNQGFFVAAGNASKAVAWVCRFKHVRYMPNESELRAKFNRGEHVEVATAGYDTMYVLCGKSLKKENTTLDDLDEGASKAKLRTAFKKSSKSSAANRAMLVSIARAVA